MDESNKKLYLQVQGQTFEINKDLLCQKSAYFGAMLSGSYRESQQDVFKFDDIEPETMQEVLKYIQTSKRKDEQYEDEEYFSCFEVSDITRLLRAALFLQVEGFIEILIKHLQEIATTHYHWIDVYEAAQSVHLSKLAQLCIQFGLYNCRAMEKMIRFLNLDKFQWYISHPFLGINAEMDTFCLVQPWYLHKATSEFKNVEKTDVINFILGLLDPSRLTLEDIRVIKTSYWRLISNGLRLLEAAEQVLSKFGVLDPNSVCEVEKSLNVARDVATDLKLFAQSSINRNNNTVLCVSAYDASKEKGPEYIYRMNRETGELERWLKVSRKKLWGWSWVTWGSRIVVSGGEYGRGTGHYNSSVAVYDTVTETWIVHRLHQLPPRRHAAAVILDNTLYLIGGVGEFRATLSSCSTFDLLSDEENRDRVEKIKRFPERIQNPAVAVFRDTIYAAGAVTLYRYIRHANEWEMVARLGVRAGALLVWRGELHMVQHYKPDLLRIDLETGATQVVKTFTNAVAGCCVAGGELIGLTHSTMEDECCVEREGRPPAQQSPQLRYNALSGCGAVFMGPVPMDHDGTNAPLARKYMAIIKSQLEGNSEKKKVTSNDETTSDASLDVADSSV